LLNYSKCFTFGHTQQEKNMTFGTENVSNPYREGFIVSSQVQLRFSGNTGVEVGGGTVHQQMVHFL
jgi:hypothetical protein